MSVYYQYTEQPPAIELVPMTQRLNTKSTKEDWTGKSDTATRRKLQNRLSQRASRQRRKKGAEEEKPENSTGPDFMLRSNNSSDTDYGHFFPNSGNHYSQSLVNRPRRPTTVCVPQRIINAMATIPCFNEFQYTPLPRDQKLLTLMHFNLIRALCQCVDLLGFTPDEMYLDVPSPFVEPQYQVSCEAQYAHHQNRQFQSLPPNMQPTVMQKMVPHHPEVDIFPFPIYRDNVIRAGKEIDDVELCMDVSYGVGAFPIWSGKQEMVDDALSRSIGTRTGLIVWSDPWLQSSWEVEEAFARKYPRLLRGCDDLLSSTNYWREQRGEEPIDFGFIDQVGESDAGFDV